jgi:hypothetical protein
MVLRTATKDENVPGPRTLIMVAARDRGRTLQRTRFGAKSLDADLEHRGLTSPAVGARHFHESGPIKWNASAPSWSPDDKEIIYRRGREEDWQLFMVLAPKYRGSAGFGKKLAKFEVMT